MGFGGMSVESFQALLDKHFRKGVHVWVVLGDGEPHTFLVPRAFVLDDTMVLLSPLDDMSIYFEVTVDNVEYVGKDEVRLNAKNGKQFRLTPATKVAAEQMKDRVKKAYEPERVGRMRAAKASELE